jgi:hypothetical protein
MAEQSSLNILGSCGVALATESSFTCKQTDNSPAIMTNGDVKTGKPIISFDRGKTWQWIIDDLFQACSHQFKNPPSSFRMDSPFAALHVLVSYCKYCSRCPENAGGGSTPLMFLMPGIWVPKREGSTIAHQPWRSSWLNSRRLTNFVCSFFQKKTIEKPCAPTAQFV